MINAIMYGDWLGTSLSLDKLPFLLQSSALWGMRKYSEKLVKIVKAHIDNQDLNWPPLSDSTVTGDPRILVDSGDYRDNIKSWRSNFVYYAGVKLNAYNGKGKNIVEYATLHEVGTNNIPKRPLWAPSIKEMGGKKGARDMVALAIYNKIKILRAKGIEVEYNGKLR